MCVCVCVCVCVRACVRVCARACVVSAPLWLRRMESHIWPKCFVLVPCVVSSYKLPALICPPLLVSMATACHLGRWCHWHCLAYGMGLGVCFLDSDLIISYLCPYWCVCVCVCVRVRVCVCVCVTDEWASTLSLQVSVYEALFFVCCFYETFICIYSGVQMSENTLIIWESTFNLFIYFFESFRIKKNI